MARRKTNGTVASSGRRRMLDQGEWEAPDEGQWGALIGW